MDLAAFIVREAEEQHQRDRAASGVVIEVTTNDGYKLNVQATRLSPTDRDVVLRYKTLEFRPNSGPGLDHAIATVNTIITDELMYSSLRRDAGEVKVMHHGQELGTFAWNNVVHLCEIVKRYVSLVEQLA